ncbi:hypothetical protein JYB64_16275 [Algoriphagus aestuarii]|nr:hypothetical protein [Algoriphagus aestuarii]
MKVHMVVSVLETGGIGLLVLIVLIAIAFLHYLLFREYVTQEKIQEKRIKDMEKLVTTEINRSKSLTHQVDRLSQIKDKTKDQLDLIKLQVDSIKAKTEN